MLTAAVAAAGPVNGEPSTAEDGSDADWKSTTATIGEAASTAFMRLHEEPSEKSLTGKTNRRAVSRGAAANKESHLSPEVAKRDAAASSRR